MHLSRFSTTNPPVSYPQEFFTHPNKKPIINIALGNVPIESLRSAVYRALTNNILNPLATNAFIYKSLVAVSESNGPDPWVSYGVTIARGDERVSVFSMADVQVSNYGFLGEVEGEISPTADKWMLFALCCLYRLTLANNTKYKRQLAISMANHFELQGNIGNFHLNASEPTHRNLVNDRNFTIMMACIDMFFCRFPDNEYSTLRMGTIVTRYRDCAGLTSFQRLSSVSGIKNLSTLRLYLCTPELEANLLQINKEWDEVSKATSYFPYQMDMRLVSRSAYSASANPSLHYWCSVICCLHGAPRSKNARLIKGKHISSTRVIAMWSAYVFAHTFKLRIHFTAPGMDVEEDSKDSEDSEDNVIGQEGRPRTYSQWFSFMKSKNYVFTPSMIQYFRGKRLGLSRCRDGSIGQHLYNTIGELLSPPQNQI